MFYSEVLNLYSSSLQIAAKTYAFSKAEKDAAMLLYRYLRPFWWSGQEAEQVKGEPQKVSKILRWAEHNLIITILVSSMCFRF